MSKDLEVLEELCELASTGDLQFQEKFNIFRRAQKVDELKPIIEKKLKALAIIKKYPRCSLQRYIGFSEMVKDGYELTQEHLFNHDMPCSVEEYNIVIEGLL